jgi:hypothetical protein
MSRELDRLLRLAEQSYIRTEAEMLITACIHDGDLDPFNDLLQELVMAGPTSLFVLREMHQIIRALKSQLCQEGLGIRQDLQQALLDFGIHLPDELIMRDTESWWPNQDLTREIQATATNLELASAALAQEICVDAGNKVSKLARRIVLANELELAVQDWISGLLYEHVHDDDALYFRERGLPEH